MGSYRPLAPALGRWVRVMGGPDPLFHLMFGFLIRWDDIDCLHSSSACQDPRDYQLVAQHVPPHTTPKQANCTRSTPRTQFLHRSSSHEPQASKQKQIKHKKAERSIPIASICVPPNLMRRIKTADTTPVPLSSQPHPSATSM